MTQDTNNQEWWEEEFDERFNFECIFGTDNFEDAEHINHPCYGHAGVHKAFKEFMIRTVRKVSQQSREDALKECVETIEDYKKWCREYALESHPDNHIMLLYDANSREIACSHILDKLKSKLPPKQ